jgi:predicted adenylyl cyclase CyaB
VRIPSATPGPPLEREIKVPVGDLEPVRRRLVALGAALLHPAALERNWVLDRADPQPAPGGALLDSGRLLRLREDARGARLTYKGPARYEGDTGSVKVREEREVAVGDGAGMLGILLALGYRVVRRYEKRREEWRLGSASIALDVTPLGAFVEVEDETPEPVARTLGLDPELATRASYLALWEEHRSAHPAASRDMVFDDGAAREAAPPGS